MFISDFADFAITSSSPTSKKKKDNRFHNAVVDTLTLHNLPSEIIGGTALGLGYNKLQDVTFRSKHWRNIKHPYSRAAQSTAVVAGTVVAGSALARALQAANKRFRKPDNSRR